MAETTITGLPNATTPLAGTERVPMDQAGATKDATTADIAALATKATVGLGNVDNTSDANKPISTATATALAGKESSGAAAAAVAAHLAAADPHTQYAPAAQGVSNGNSHNHDGGDGAQIAYSSLSGLPTLPTGTNTGDQTLANTSNATSHTVTLSGSGGSLQLVEGSNVTLATSGTGSAAVVTISASVTGGGGGDVVGPASSVDGRAALFDGATGKLLKQSSAAPVLEGDSRLTDARTPTAHNQAASTITGLATVATTGAYADLSGKPTLGGAAVLNVGTSAGTVAAGDDSRFATDLTFDASTRLLSSSTGADVTLPLVTSTTAGLAPLSGGGTSNFLRADGTWAAPAGGGGISDGDKGDITVSAGGATWTIDNGAIGTAKLGGDITTAGKALLDDADAAAQRTTLGAAPAQSVYAVGNWIAPFEGGVSTTGSTLTANTIALYAFTVRRSITVDNLGARVGTVAASSNVQLAIYGSDSSNKITGTALAATGNLSGATATSVSASVTAFTLQAGLIYWMAINSSGTPAMYGPGTTNTYQNSILGGSSLVDALGATTFTLTLRTVAQTFGTWPDLTATTPTVVSGNANAQKGAILALQISALP